ncbi:GTP cyclohydrolase FolE2 [Candidatus Xiphinematobacter sp. Idaho Grape]|uniref:GTP cyclohydrolase FolE2 n=1 Tax=Candidatus Xiphinematobacter sp. Idaho Grape TaxID=1704307 RepID=UPI000705BA7F|nr:GTP cyclohydrolase FolE2 [Candidatus Xiphinematobacter sp. Idaho Grape]ALJ56973.1 GTP cyclohydrolase FolE2 [Candidatus Xiphinematobacter sp. Idaho Grape]
MKSIDYSLIDTQSSLDHRKIAIKRVGIKNLRYPVQIRDKQRHTLQSTIATVLLTVDLPAHRRGTHMSRFIEALHSHSSILHVENIYDIPIQLQRKLQSFGAHMELEFPFFLEKKAPVTHSSGLIDYTVRLGVTLVGEERDFMLTVVVPITTLCPCSKAISIQGAHSQRGQVACSARFERPMWIEDLIRMVEKSASCELYSLLKRPDEKAVTEHAYTHPVFVEDLVRNIAILAEENSKIVWYRIEAENFESIHNHNAYALVEREATGSTKKCDPYCLR